MSSNKMKIVPLLLLIAPAALAAPMSAEDSGEEVDHLVDSVHCSSFCQDFDNLTLSRAGEFGDSGEDFEVDTLDYFLMLYWLRRSLN